MINLLLKQFSNETIFPTHWIALLNQKPNDFVHCPLLVHFVNSWNTLIKKTSSLLSFIKHVKVLLIGKYFATDFYHIKDTKGFVLVFYILTNVYKIGKIITLSLPTIQSFKQLYNVEFRRWHFKNEVSNCAGKS